MSTTLLELFAITRLSPLGEDRASAEPAKCTHFDRMEDICQATFMSRFHEDLGEVTQKEHAAFLLFRLPKQVSKDLVNLALLSR